MIYDVWEIPGLISEAAGRRIAFSQLVLFIKQKDRFYRTIKIKKIRGGERVLDAPKGVLKSVQRGILKNILYKRSIVHPYCHGFVKGRSIITNASLHVNKKYILKLDIKDFFPSITDKRVKNEFQRLGFNETMSNFLTELVTYKGRLPQGAPTSPYLSNLVCKKLDTRLFRYAKKIGLTYSRYADDMIFSGVLISCPMVRHFKKLVVSEGFQINESKSRVISKSSKQIVCGIVVNNRVTLGRKKYQNMKAFIHNCGENGVYSENKRRIIKFKEHLLGKISLLKNLDYKKWEKLDINIKNLDWDNKIIHNELIKRIDDINNKLLIFRDTKFLQKAVYQECETLDGLNSRMLELFNLIDRMDVSYFENKSAAALNADGTVNKVKAYLKGFDSTNATNLYGRTIPIWTDIKMLADHLKRHESEKNDKKIRRIYEDYGIDISNPHYEHLRYALLQSFAISLDALYASIK